MAEFEIIEQEGMKMIKAIIQNETVTAEAGALHYLQGKIEIATPSATAGGFLRSMVTQETIFRPTYTGTGEIYFGPPIFGEYHILDVENSKWILDKGAYVCSDGEISVGAIRNKAVASMLGGEGWFQTSVEGQGRVIIQADGPIQVIDLQDDRLAVDGSFAVAREAHLDFKVEKATKSFLGSMGSGEGLLNVISGTGRVYIAPVPNAYANMLNEIRSGLMSVQSSSS